MRKKISQSLFLANPPFLLREGQNVGNVTSYGGGGGGGKGGEETWSRPKGKKGEEERVGIAKEVQYGRRLRRISGGGYSQL